MGEMQALRSHQTEPITLNIGPVLTIWSCSRQSWPFSVPKNSANNGTVPELSPLQLQSRVGNSFVLPRQGGIFLSWFATDYISFRNSWDGRCQDWHTEHRMRPSAEEWSPRPDPSRALSA